MGCRSVLLLYLPSVPIAVTQAVAGDCACRTQEGGRLTCSSSQRGMLHAGRQPARDAVQLALLLLPNQGPEGLQQGQSHVAVCQRQGVAHLQEDSAAAAAPSRCQLDCSG